MIGVMLMGINIIFFVIMLIVLKNLLYFKEKMIKIRFIKMRDEM